MPYDESFLPSAAFDIFFLNLIFYTKNWLSVATCRPVHCRESLPHWCENVHLNLKSSREKASTFIVFKCLQIILQGKTTPYTFRVFQLLALSLCNNRLLWLRMQSNVDAFCTTKFPLKHQWHSPPIDTWMTIAKSNNAISFLTSFNIFFSKLCGCLDFRLGVRYFLRLWISLKSTISRISDTHRGI